MIWIEWDGFISGIEGIWKIIQVNPLLMKAVKQVEAHTPVQSFPFTPAELITFAGAILVALIALFGVMYQIRRNSLIEREKILAQRELELERIRFQDEINAARAAGERQRQQKEMDAEITRTAMKRAKDIAERDQVYRDALHSDPRIARLQILDMSYPLDVTNVYVRVRLHQETKSSYELNQRLVEAQAKGNILELLRIDHNELKDRASSTQVLDPDEAIRKHKRSVFVGDPGAGKTTLLKYLTLKAAEKRLINLPNLPIYIELNAFAISGYRDLLEYISTRWDDRYDFPKVEAREYIEEAMKTGNALLLLDGLDETWIGNSNDQAEGSYNNVLDAVITVATRYHKSPIVVTARKAGYHQHKRLEGFTELEVLDFRPEEIEQFVRNWFDNSPRQYQHATAADLNAKLSRNPRLHALASNPLLLSLIVIVYEDRLDLPDRRVELYERCVDTLLAKWDTSRDIRRRREFKPEHKQRLLEEVAWHFHNQGLRYFPESELLNIIGVFLPAIGLPTEQNIRVLEEIAAENGLLKEQARHWYGFLHLTLQEYFVARYAADNQQLEELLTHQVDPWWEEVLVLYAGQISDASQLLQKLIGQDTDTILQENSSNARIVLTGRCLAARPVVRQVLLRETVLKHLFQSLISNSSTRSQIAVTLVEIGVEEVNIYLVSLLADENQDISVRWAVAEALGQLGERVIAYDLIPLLANEKLNKSVRVYIAKALGQLGERAVIPDMKRLLADKNLGPYLREQINRAIKQLEKHPRASHEKMK